MALPAPSDLPRPFEVDALNQRAHSLRHQDTRQALSLCHQARDLALSIDYQNGLAEGAYLISLCRFILGEGDDVLDQAWQAHSLFQSLGDRRGEANALNLIGNIYSRQSRSADALENFQRSLDLRRAIGDQAGESGSLNNIALVQRDNGQFPEALESLFASLEAAETVPDPESAAYALHNIGSILAEIGDHAHAQEYFQRGLALNQQTNDRALESTILLELGRALAGLGDHSAALDRLQHALALSQQTGNLNDQGLAWLALGITQAETGDHPRAGASLERALALVRQTEDVSGETEALLAQGQNALAQGRTEQAISLLHQALTLAERHVIQPQVGKIHRLLSQAHEQQADPAKALEHFRAFYETEQRVMGVETQRRIRALLGGAEVQQARREADAERRKRHELAYALDAAQESDRQKEQLLAQLHSQAETLKQLAREDGLTSIANRRWLDIQLAREVERASRFGHPLSIVMLDLDDFKSVNDTCSHLVGDEVLRSVARLLRDYTRTVDVIGRYGGDEFLLILVETPLDRAQTVCETIRAALAGYGWTQVHAALKTLTVSVGLCGLTAGDTAQTLLARADDLLYRAKRQGKDQISVEG
ncbi:MAG: GGDEF domain-containing protein [Chloroflexi bacterium]|nr:GGDEF domain-containing protein [Chloroflexota bacterium]